LAKSAKKQITGEKNQGNRRKQRASLPRKLLENKHALKAKETPDSQEV
jgi:hypothetical protein